MMMIGDIGAVELIWVIDCDYWCDTDNDDDDDNDDSNNDINDDDDSMMYRLINFIMIYLIQHMLW